LLAGCGYRPRLDHWDYLVTWQYLRLSIALSMTNREDPPIVPQEGFPKSFCAPFLPPEQKFLFQNARSCLEYRDDSHKNMNEG
jgi:hypothetical protein